MTDVEKQYAVQIVPLLQASGDWLASLEEAEDPVITFAHRLPRRIVAGETVHIERAPDRVADAFALRERFFRVKSSESALAFFQDFGPLHLADRFATTAAPVRLSYIRDFRDHYRSTLLNPGAAKWQDLEIVDFQQNLPVELLPSSPMRAIARCKDVAEALRATVFLDRLEGRQWKLCEREGCGQPFQITNKRVRR